MTRDEAIELARTLTDADAQTLFNSGLALIRDDFAEILLPQAELGAGRFPADPRIQQLLGLAARTAGRSDLAYSAFAEAARLAPRDPLIAHSHARTALEAGKASASLFEAAFRLNSRDGSILLGRAAARLQEQDADLAVRELEEILRQNPLWIDGHRSLAQLLGQLGLDPLRSVNAAIAASPGNAELHKLRIALLLEARDLDRVEQAAEESSSRFGSPPWAVRYAAHIASERNDIAAADRLFAQLPPSQSVDEVSLLARHAIRAGKYDIVSAMIEGWIERDHDHLLWPYLSLAWRLTGDPRWEWLEGSENLIGVYDLADRVADLEGLAAHLRKLHVTREAPLDQSVRGGTQTDGNLLLRDEPPIRALKALIQETVARHIDQLPPPEPGHPTLPACRTPQRIAGSWSVRLLDAGFHTDHVHSQGWISSAFYVALPAMGDGSDGGSAHEGWLSLGECRELLPALEPVRLVEPRVGRLVLFPSTMWHGTRPFASGERMTVAFDIAPPKQS